MKFALEVRDGGTAAAEFATKLLSAMESAGAEPASEVDAPDLVIGVGGDGTMLAAVRRALRSDAPVLGFNLGTMGFLAAADPETLEEVVSRILEGEYDIVERMTVAATVNGETTSGVNDVVVEKIDAQRLVELAVTIDGLEFVTYRADGIIIATPTGSTAYSFSAGGPLVDHGLEALVMTPVAAHSLFDRSMVLPPSTEIEMRVIRDRSVHVTVDKSDLGHLGAGESVLVRRGHRPARFVSFNGQSFAGLVKTKFSLQ